ncbi:MAG: glycosyltransferase [Acetatifactor sp.]|nr:glycosyltransferase [Acetatifactor sp.]
MFTVQILLSTYNGMKYLDALVESLLAQQEVSLRILVRDDGSTDGTQAMLEQYQEKGILEWFQGESIKPAQSFRELMKKAGDAEYYAFCDQDDFWMPQKLTTAIGKLKEYADMVPCLYCGKPQLVNERLEPIQSKRGHHIIHATKFGARLIVRNAIGCTFVFNRRLLDEVNRSEPLFLEMHDIWTYEVCNVLGGFIYYDDAVPILYRQHSDNTVGTNIQWKKRWKDRVRRFKEKNHDKLKTTQEIYRCFGDVMDSEKRHVTEMLMNYQHGIRGRIRVMTSRHYSTDSKRMNRNFKIAILLGIF